MASKEYYCQNVPCYLEMESSKTLGKFTILETQGFVAFEWKSDDFAPFSIQTYNFHQALIYHYLHHIQSIQIMSQDKDGNHKYQFSIPQLPSYSRFIFANEDDVIITQALESLKKKSYISPHPQYNNIFKVNIKRSENVVYPPNSLNLNQLQCLYAQKVSLSKLPPLETNPSLSPFSLSDFKSHEQPDGTIKDFPAIKDHVFLKGLEDSARPYLWPYFYHYYLPEMTTTEKTALLKKRYDEFSIYIEQLNTYDATLQKYYDIAHTECVQDALRTERNNIMFENDDGPGIRMLSTILQVYALYDMDTKFVQGMSDIAVQFFSVFIKEIQDKDKILMFNDEIYTEQQAESFIFWNFAKMMQYSQHSSLFGNLKICQQFIAERAFTIAANANSLLGEWLTAKELNSLIFLYSPFLLLFKRYLSPNIVPKVWDVLLSSDDFNIFLRFLTAAVLFYLFPEITAEKNVHLGGVTNLLSGEMLKLNGDDIINLAQQFLLKAQKDTAQNQWLFMELPSNHERVYFQPELFSLIQSV